MDGSAQEGRLPAGPTSSGRRRTDGLRGHTALVTGAGLVGTEIAVTLAEAGAGAVVVADLSEARAEEAAGAVRAAGADALAVAGDITEAADVAALATAVAGWGRTVQILVNNAGMPPGFFEGPSGMLRFVDTTPDDWEPVLRLNLTAVLQVTHAFLRPMLDSGWGRVITVVSDAGRVGEARMAAYAAAKAGAAGFMRSLATEVGRHGVTANCLSLGTIWRQGPDTPPSEEARRDIARRYPVGRLGTPADVAAMVRFLASDAAEWITGQVYPVNGGYSYAQ